MSVNPTGFSSSGITVEHEGTDHAGTIAFSALSFYMRPDGTPDRQRIVIPCPVCSAVSTHPVGGGSAPRAIQRLFVHMLRRIGAQNGGVLPSGIVTALGLPDNDVTTWAAAKDKIRLLVERMDGVGRFQIADINENDS